MYKQAIIDITGKCNISCKHCYASSKYSGNKRNDMTLENVFNTIDLLKEYGYTNVLFLGGEPLYRADILEIIKYTVSIGIKVMINTNGILLNDLMCTNLIKLGVEQISVSFEGTDSSIHDKIAGKGNFDKTLKGLRKLIDLKNELKSDIFIGIQFTISKYSLHDAKNIIPFSIMEKVNGVNINFLDNIGNAKRNENDIGVSVEESIDFIENMLKECDLTGLRDLVIQIPAKKYLLQYLKHKYCINIEEGPVGYSCSAGDRIILIENDGIVTPCGIANNMIYETKNKNKFSDLEYEELYIYDYKSEKELLETKYFSSFLDLKKNSCFDFCEDCQFKNECNPCPIDSKRDEEQCLVSKRRYNQFVDKLINTKININISKLFMDEINDSGKKILELFSSGFTILQVVDMLAEKHEEDKEKILCDLLEFHYSLSVNGILLQR